MVKAIAVLKGTVGVGGVVTFEQNSENEPTKISYKITGNSPNALKGFHIHEFGDNTNGCTSAGPHFNPFNNTHGAPTETVRHVGDLGNIKTDAQGVATGEIFDSLVKLIGPTSIIGRTVVVHDGEDDLGKGGHPDSLKTGNAGGRPACGVIGFAA
ncbi:superoxide dismutase SOD1 [Ascoidea rubescens DSM 1968]|uniref:Superoxide dismutase [Cu-Zn] n=1 Tax=Ascoidea rubescens DSM 1968 TaxID=1344418 RepID=A0A1D2VDP1_9ASCO|nr:cytosolic superoxide dismutase [Ascoidea rubescens DSM 1968]ODV59630.1 cytosolic superoxide dismutase [Ascoidea rubescens DSM 1968]